MGCCNEKNIDAIQSLAPGETEFSFLSYSSDGDDNQERLDKKFNILRSVPLLDFINNLESFDAAKPNEPYTKPFKNSYSSKDKFLTENFSLENFLSFIENKILKMKDVNEMYSDEEKKIFMNVVKTVYEKLKHLLDNYYKNVITIKKKNLLPLGLLFCPSSGAGKTKFFYQIFENENGSFTQSDDLNNFLLSMFILSGLTENIIEATVEKKNSLTDENENEIIKKASDLVKKFNDEFFKYNDFFEYKEFKNKFKPKQNSYGWVFNPKGIKKNINNNSYNYVVENNHEDLLNFEEDEINPNQNTESNKDLEKLLDNNQNNYDKNEVEDLKKNFEGIFKANNNINNNNNSTDNKKTKDEIDTNKAEKNSKEEEWKLNYSESQNSMVSSEEEKDIYDELINDEEPLEISKKTKIVSTLGPASSTKEIIQSLYKEGVNIFRLNFSHGTHESHGKMIDLVRSLNLRNAGIMLDTKGPEIRIGEIRDKIHIKIGDDFIMTTDIGVYEDTGKISVNYKAFSKDVDVGDIIVIDSGIIQAKAIEKHGEDIKFKVINGEDDLTTKKHINLYGKKVSLPSVTEQDWKDIDFGIEKKVDFIALSFVSNGDVPKEVRDYCRKKGANIQIISKIENYESTTHLENIVRESDGVMFARGDLSCEINFGTVPILQKQVCAYCSYYNKPIIIATQMCLSMVTNIQPTRAEVSDIGNAIFDGADAIMTSEETTKSIHPTLVIRTMARVATETEDNIYSICTKPYCDDCFGIMHRGRLQRKGFENYTYHRPYHHIQQNKKKQKEREFQKNFRRKLSLRLSNAAEQENISEGIRNFRKSMSKRLSARLSCISVDIYPNTLKENIFTIAPYITDNIEAICSCETENDNFTKNISASRINIPMFAFTNSQMLANQMNLIWNIQPIYTDKINGDFNNDSKFIDGFFDKKNVKKYLLVTKRDGMPILQVRDLLIHLFK